MAKRVLFVCAANRNRSPAAEFVYNLLAGGGAVSAGLQSGEGLDPRMALALKKKYGSRADSFIKNFKPRRVPRVLPVEVYAMDYEVLLALGEGALFPPRGVKDPAAVYPAKTGDPYLDTLNEIELGIKIILN